MKHSRAISQFVIDISEDNVDDDDPDHDHDAMTIVVMKKWQFLTDKWDEVVDSHKELWNIKLYKKQ